MGLVTVVEFNDEGFVDVSIHVFPGWEPRQGTFQLVSIKFHEQQQLQPRS